MPPLPASSAITWLRRATTRAASSRRGRRRRGRRRSRPGSDRGPRRARPRGRARARPGRPSPRRGRAGPPRRGSAPSALALRISVREKSSGGRAPPRIRRLRGEGWGASSSSLPIPAHWEPWPRKTKAGLPLWAAPSQRRVGLAVAERAEAVSISSRSSRPPGPGAEGWRGMDQGVGEVGGVQLGVIARWAPRRSAWACRAASALAERRIGTRAGRLGRGLAPPPGRCLLEDQVRVRAADPEEEMPARRRGRCAARPSAQ